MKKFKLLTASEVKVGMKVKIFCLSVSEVENSHSSIKVFEGEVKELKEIKPGSFELRINDDNPKPTFIMRKNSPETVYQNSVDEDGNMYVNTSYVVEA